MAGQTPKSPPAPLGFGQPFLRDATIWTITDWDLRVGEVCKIKVFETEAPHFKSSLASGAKSVYTIPMVKVRRYSELKQEEAVRRLRVMHSRGTRHAAKQQRRVSLVGNGAKWRITNLKKVSAAMAKWA
jgi:hypothetical protein